MSDKTDIEKCNCGQFYVRGDYLYCPKCGEESVDMGKIESFVIDQAIEDHYLTIYEERRSAEANEK